MDWKKILKYIILDFFIAYAIVVGMLWIFQENFVYYPNDQDFFDCDGFRHGIEVNGTRMYVTDVTDRVVVFYHGNTGSACDRSFLNEHFVLLGYSTVFVEYAGYSNDDVSPSKKRILADVRNVASWLDSQDYVSEVVVGQSIGTGVASYHQTIRSPDKMILLSPPHNFKAVAKTAYWFMPVDLLMRNEFPNDEWLSGYSGELLLIAGSDDVTIPMSFTQELYDGLSIEGKKMVVVPGGKHNDLWLHEETLKAVEEFLD